METRNLNRPKPMTIQMQMVSMVEQLESAIRNQTAKSDDFASLQRLLSSLAMTTSEYATASSRLKSACNYVLQGESGAASFELRLLAGLVRRLR